MSDLLLLAERDARDGVTDALGFGITAPIQNLPLPEETLAVPHDTPAEITLGYSQPAARYRLATGDCRSVRGRSAPGNGGPLVLRSEKVTESRTYTICAHKGGRRPVPLVGTVRVRPGLDVTLAARVPLDREAGVGILDQTLDRPFPDGAARVTPFGTELRVEIDAAQEGVDYTLEAEPAADDRPGAAASAGAARGRGRGSTTVLRSTPLDEDRVLRIRARRDVGRMETRLLEVRLPVMVKANPGLAATLREGPIAAFAARHRLGIAGSQASASYRVFARPIPDIDYRPAGLPAARVGTVAVEGAPRVRVALPEPFLDWRAPRGFAPVTEPVAGTGGDLEIELPAARADQVLLVQASKTHTPEGGLPVPSRVRLAAAVVLLVRPDPAPDLDLRLVTGGVAAGGGEPGVYYYLRAQADPGGEAKRPAYIHQRDPSDPALNKGIGEPATGGLAIGVDLAIARDVPVPPGEAPSPTTDPPATPIVGSKGLAASGVLYLRAVSAQTRIAQALSEHARIPAAAEVRADATEIEAGGKARIVVLASDPLDRYELWRGGKQERRALNGDGGELVFVSDPIDTDTLLVMRVTRREPEGLPIAREVPIPIRVRPAS